MSTRDTIVQVYLATRNISEVSRRTGISHRSVRTVLVQEGFIAPGEVLPRGPKPGPRPISERARQIAAAYQQAGSVTAAGHALGISHQAASQSLLRLRRRADREAAA